MLRVEDWVEERRKVGAKVMVRVRPWKSRLWLCLGKAAVTMETNALWRKLMDPGGPMHLCSLRKQQSDLLIMPMFSSYLFSYFYRVSIVCPRNNINRCCFDYFCILTGQEIAVDFLNRSV